MSQERLLNTPILYFPVKPTPLQMEAGFYPLGKDLGGQELDQHCFLLDQEYENYQKNKRDNESFGFWVTWKQTLETQEEIDFSAIHILALEKIVELQKYDLGLPPPSLYETWQKQMRVRQDSQEASTLFAQLSQQLYQILVHRVQEDITVLAHEPKSALVMGHICTPSFWDPQHVKDQSFWSIHKPVPQFPRDERVATRLSEHIAKKGPFVRFVWTLSADQKLDHNPRHPRLAWSEAQDIYYRVERQITIPLDGQAALFLIRTYVHSLERLSSTRRSVLRKALELMPKDIADYKGLSGLKHDPALLDLIAHKSN